MDPATISLIIWIITFLLSKKAGLSNTQSALVATGAAAAGYYVANGNSFSGNAVGTDTGGTTSSVATLTTAGTASTSILGTVGTAAAGVGSWVAANPGAAATIAGGVAIASTSSTWSKYLPWLVGAAAALLIAR